MKDARLAIRLQADTKTLIQQAAELRDQSLTEFVISTLSAEAETVMAEHTNTVLSDRDRDLFLKLLDSPPRPNKALRKAAANAQRSHPANRSSHDRST